MFGGIPIVATRIPHHGRQAKFLRDVQHAWPAAAERRPKPFHALIMSCQHVGSAHGQEHNGQRRISAT